MQILKILSVLKITIFFLFYTPASHTSLLNPVWGADQRQQRLWSETIPTCLQNPSEDFPTYNWLHSAFSVIAPLWVVRGTSSCSAASKAAQCSPLVCLAFLSSLPGLGWEEASPALAVLQRDCLPSGWDKDRARQRGSYASWRCQPWKFFYERSYLTPNRLFWFLYRTHVLLFRCSQQLLKHCLKLVQAKARQGKPSLRVHQCLLHQSCFTQPY